MSASYFDPRYEQESIDEGLTERTQEIGFTLPWWFFDEEASLNADPYNEGSYIDPPGPLEGGFRWKGPHPMPVLSATRTQGMRTDPDVGLYTIDQIVLYIPYRMAVSSGLLPPPDESNQHLQDRFLFDNLIWGVSSMTSRNLLGGGGTRSMIAVLAAQVTADELVNDADFQQWAQKVDNA